MSAKDFLIVRNTMPRLGIKEEATRSKLSI